MKFRHKTKGGLYKVISWGYLEKQYEPKEGGEKVSLPWIPRPQVIYQSLEPNKHGSYLVYGRHIDDFNKKFEEFDENDLGNGI